MKRFLRGLKINEVSLVDAPANPLARVMLAKAAAKPIDLAPLQALTGLDRMKEIERRAQAAEPDLSLDNALEFAFRKQPALKTLYLEAQALARARDANLKRAGEQLDDVIIVLRKRAEKESEQPSADEVFKKIRDEASSRYARLFERNEQAAVDRVLCEQPQLYEEYRKARSTKTTARAAYADAVLLGELAPLTRLFRADGLTEAEASARALELVPALKLRRDSLIAIAKAGARISWGGEDPFAADSLEHLVLAMTISSAARGALKRGQASTGIDAVKFVLAEDLALGARARGDEAGAERLKGLTKSAVERDPEAYRQYRERGR